MLRFSPLAWAKLVFWRDVGPTEIGGFGISAENDPLLVEDVRLVGQRADATNVVLLDEAVADYFDDCVDAGLTPERCSRIWLHTHPADSAHPSWQDEETFERVFGNCDWAVMAIVAKGGERYARLRFGVGPGGQIRIKAKVDWSVPFSGTDHATWEREYNEHVKVVTPVPDDVDALAGWPDELPLDDWGQLLDLVEEVPA